MALEGEVELTGRVRPHPDSPELDALCLFPDSASADRLPVFPGESRYSWLCFENHEEAERMLAGIPPGGEARVRIDRYRYTFVPTDAYNTARLVRLAGPGGAAAEAETAAAAATPTALPKPQ